MLVGIGKIDHMINLHDTRGDQLDCKKLQDSPRAQILVDLIPHKLDQFISNNDQGLRATVLYIQMQVDLIPLRLIISLIMLLLQALLRQGIMALVLHKEHLGGLMRSQPR
jgi:hypothetical protein